MGNAKKEASRRERKGQTKEFSNVKVKVRIPKLKLEQQLTILGREFLP
jgi:hypothetical protein